MKKLILPVIVSFGALVSYANATTIAQWTFETSLPLLNNSATISGILPEVGLGTASGVHASAATDWSNPVGNGSNESLSANEWAVGDYFQFEVSTVGLSGIGVSFDHTSSTTGPRDFALRYSTDGSSFTTFSSYSVLTNSAPINWNSTTYQSVHSFLFDLSSETSIDNNATVYFRLVNSTTVSANGGTVALSGTSRIDNFTVFSPVPEPSTATLAMLGGLLSLWATRRRA